MNTSHRQWILPVVLELGALASTSTSSAQPIGWVLTGRSKDGFEAALDDKVTLEGKVTARLQSKVPGAEFASLAQLVDAADYRGKRIRFGTTARTEEVVDWAGLWLRIDSASDPIRSYQDTQGTPVHGYSYWQSLQIVIDVPGDARTIYFGLGQSGTGTAWFGPVTFEVVDKEVPLDPDPKISANAKRTPLVCLTEAPTGSHIPRHACYDRNWGRIVWLASADYARGLRQFGGRVFIPRGWRWYWGR